jgi:hypothetical protein
MVVLVVKDPRAWYSTLSIPVVLKILLEERDHPLVLEFDVPKTLPKHEKQIESLSQGWTISLI